MSFRTKMNSQNLEPTTIAAVQLPRAQRIPDEEWGKYREKLVKLYVEEDISRKDIIGTMAKEHSFVITDKQLKHRFKKWGIKKYIPDPDMTIMLSLKRKRHAEGKDVRFQYKGLDIEQERIERAYKRQKGQLLSPIVIPSCIKAYTPPRNDFGVPENAALVKHTKGLDIPLLDSSTQVTEPDGVSFYTGSNQDLASFASENSNITNMMTYAPDSPFNIPSPQFPEVILSPVENLAARSVREGSFCLSEFLNYSPVPNSPNGIGIEPFPHVQLDRRISSCGSVFPLEVVTTSNEPRDRAKKHRSISRNDFEVAKNPDWVVCPDVNPEELVRPLQQLEKQFVISLDQNLLNSTCAGSSLNILFELTHSEWLRLKVEDLVCWSYLASLKGVQQRQAARSALGSGTGPNLPSWDGSSPSGQDITKNVFEPELPAKDTSYFLRHSRKGVLRIQLSTTSKESIDDNDSEPPTKVTISFMPKAKKRTIGVSATFTKSWNTLVESRISPYIKAFNVLPQGSKIIQCVSDNDLQGLRKLFDGKKASPLDVDQWGFSLLSYAIYTGCSVVFRLLLEGGAGTYNCNLGSYTSDIIWTIWHYFVDSNYGPESEKYGSQAISDVDQCVSMTEVVLSHGFDIENTICYDESIASALYEITMAEYLPPSAPEKALECLINAGYDKEKQNSKGQTPLLHAANSFAPQVIKCLKVFIRKGVNVHAVDIAGRGALHSALAAPTMLEDWSFKIDEGIDEHLITYPGDLYWNSSLLYCAEDKMHAEDYIEESFDTVMPTQQSAVTRVYRGNTSSRTCVDGDDIDTHNYMHLDLVQEAYGTKDLMVSDGSDQCEINLGVDDAALCDAKRSDKDDYDDVNSNKDDALSGGEPVDEHIFCKDHNGLERWIRNPIRVLKRRLRFKLLVLLEAGCDPNAVDNENQSVSDYATKSGLGPQWKWALEKTGYIYDAITGSWVKALTSS